MTVRWAFIGAGRHAELWIAPALEGASNAEAVGVWSRQADNAAAFAARHQIPTVYPTLEAALADLNVDAVFISTPNNLHGPHTLAALQAGKHVLCEKPMAVSVDEAREMVLTAREAGRQLGLGFHLRHHQLLVEARRRVADGDVGAILYATAQFNLTSSPPPRMNIPHAPWKRDPTAMGGAAALMGMGVHLIDVLRFLLGQEIVSVSAFAVDYRPELPLETFAQVMLEFDGGAQGHLVYGGRFPLSKNDIVLYGASGRIVAESVVDVRTMGSLHVSVPEGPTGLRTDTHQPVLVDNYQREIEAFSAAIESGKPFAASGIDGLRSVEVQTAIIESQRNGQRVGVTRISD
jgi:1,5-anhydro-D-fructose reductase (1,5-anhydro-D-mannitol-forming)